MKIIKRQHAYWCSLPMLAMGSVAHGADDLTADKNSEEKPKSWSWVSSAKPIPKAISRQLR